MPPPPLTTVLVLHIVAGSLALLSGYVSLYSAKGNTLHRQTGRLFVYSMLAMCIFAITLEATRLTSPSTNIPAAILSAYLVITSMLAVQPASRSPRWLTTLGTTLAGGIGLTSLSFAAQAMLNGKPPLSFHTFPHLLFGSAGLIGAIFDIQVLRNGHLQGKARIARHLWRMCFALFIAAMSFFLGQAKVIPKPIRIPALLALPILAVLLTMLYWLWRTRLRPATAQHSPTME